MLKISKVITTFLVGITMMASFCVVVVKCKQPGQGISLTL